MVRSSNHTAVFGDKAALAERIGGFELPKLAACRSRYDSARTANASELPSVPGVPAASGAGAGAGAGAGVGLIALVDGTYEQFLIAGAQKRWEAEVLSPQAQAQARLTALLPQGAPVLAQLFAQMSCQWRHEEPSVSRRKRVLHSAELQGLAETLCCSESFLLAAEPEETEDDDEEKEEQMARGKKQQHKEKRFPGRQLLSAIELLQSPSCSLPPLSWFQASALQTSCARAQAGGGAFLWGAEQFSDTQCMKLEAGGLTVFKENNNTDYSITMGLANNREGWSSGCFQWELKIDGEMSGVQVGVMTMPSNREVSNFGNHVSSIRGTELWYVTPPCALAAAPCAAPASLGVHACALLLLRATPLLAAAHVRCLCCA